MGLAIPADYRLKLNGENWRNTWTFQKAERFAENEVDYNPIWSSKNGSRDCKIETDWPKPYHT